MTTPVDDIKAVRTDPGGVAWTVLLVAALVLIIGLIGYLVFTGEAVPVAAPPAPAPVAGR